MRRLFLRTIAAVLVLVALAIGGVYAYLRRSLPQIEGTATAAGLSAPIDIVRDADAIPHVYAANKHDALFGLGYVHAQDRLWQMELQRRIGHGRLSEVLGEAALPQDRFLRTVGFGRAARTAWASMPGWATDQINAYVAGVNAFISTHHGSALPPEFSLLRFEPEPWTGPDVVVWVKMMAWDLSANYAFELLRHDLVAAVGSERMAQLMPPYPANGLSIVDPNVARAPQPGGPADVARRLRAEGASASLAGARADHERAEAGRLQPSGTDSWSHALATALSAGDPAIREFLRGGATTEALGSNNWVVDGTLTATGKPLLANDPHLSAHMPSTWYLAHVSGGDFEMIGATLPGAPAVALGRNRFIAWGATNVAADVEDLYRERLDGGGTHAEFRGAQEPVTVIPETIIVEGRAPVRVDVRVTRHGPLISDALNAINADLKTGPRPPPLEPLAFRWTALDAADSTVPAFLRLNEARNWGQFTEALRDFVTPSQNFVYADVDGHIGYYAPGRIPVRAAGDGSLPADGWTGAAEWTGWIPFDELPHIYDPPEHFIVTANHRPEPPTYPHLLGLEWPEPYRAQRIIDLLGTGHQQTHRFTPDDFARIQSDTLSLHAQALLPLLLAHVHPESAPDQQAVGLLRQWNFDAAADSAATAIFEAWFYQLAPTLVGDDLGPLVTERYAERFSFVTRFVEHTLAVNDVTWCDDRATARQETCDDAVTAALHNGVTDLTKRLGGDMTRWRWDAVHIAVFPHQLGAVAALRPLLSRAVPNGGDWSTVNVGAAAADQLYEQHAVAGYREIIDLSPANDSRFLDAVGEAGHALSKHYDDFLKDWRAVTHKKMRMDRADVERGALGTLRLSPR
jgi:penicillin amidase